MTPVNPENKYDWTDSVQLVRMMQAKGLRLAAYRVRDPETGEFSSVQYHMTYGNTVLAVMSEGTAELFADFVRENPAA